MDSSRMMKQVTQRVKKSAHIQFNFPPIWCFRAESAVCLASESNRCNKLLMQHRIKTICQILCWCCHQIQFDQSEQGRGPWRTSCGTWHWQWIIWVKHDGTWALFVSLYGHSIRFVWLFCCFSTHSWRVYVHIGYHYCWGVVCLLDYLGGLCMSRNINNARTQRFPARRPLLSTSLIAGFNVLVMHVWLI